jgi:hypothetical protein
MIDVPAFDDQPVALLCVHRCLPALSGSTSSRLLARAAKLNTEMGVMARDPRWLPIGSKAWLILR